MEAPWSPAADERTAPPEAGQEDTARSEAEPGRLGAASLRLWSRGPRRATGAAVKRRANPGQSPSRASPLESAGCDGGDAAELRRSSHPAAPSTARPIAPPLTNSHALRRDSRFAASSPL